MSGADWLSFKFMSIPLPNSGTMIIKLDVLKHSFLIVFCMLFLGLFVGGTGTGFCMLLIGPFVGGTQTDFCMLFLGPFVEGTETDLCMLLLGPFVARTSDGVCMLPVGLLVAWAGIVLLLFRIMIFSFSLCWSTIPINCNDLALFKLL